MSAVTTIGSSDRERFDRTVQRLVLQYREYAALTQRIAELEAERFAALARIAARDGVRVPAVIVREATIPELEPIRRGIALATRDLQRLSDEMSFANPYIWVMYKYRAYRSTSTEIATLDDLRRHCSPSGYICTIRYAFLRAYLRDHHGVDLDDRVAFPDAMTLPDFAQSTAMTALLNDLEFLEQWKEREYRITDDRINKWDTAMNSRGM